MLGPSSSSDKDAVDPSGDESEPGESGINIPCCSSIMELSSLMKEEISKVLPHFLNEDKKSCLTFLESCSEWSDFEKHPAYDEITMKELKMIKPICENYFKAKKRLLVEPKCDPVIHKLVEEVGCTEETGRWVFENISNFPSLDTLLDQPELETLTMSQVKKLRKTLETLNNVETTVKDDGVSLEMEISSKLGLDFRLCREIVKQWHESNNLDVVFDSELCDNLTMRQRKVIVSILTESKAESVGNDESLENQNRKELNELRCFLETIECKLPENDMREIWTSAGKQNISVLQEALANVAMKTLQKFQVCLHILKNYPSHDVMNEVLLKSVEFTNLRKKFEECVFEAEVTNDGKTWFYENILEDLNNVDDFENCDFITVKQLRTLKAELEDDMARFTEVKEELFKYQKLHERKISAVNFSGSGNEKAKSNEAIDRAESISLETDTDNFHVRGTETVGSVRSFRVPAGSVSENTKSEEQQENNFEMEFPPKEEFGIQNAHSDSKEQETESESQAEQSAKHSTWPLFESNFDEIETFPLITCAERTQGERIVEQFLVKAESIQRLCNLKEGSDNYYHDKSSGLNINFTELKNYKLDLAGVLGSLDNAQKFFGKMLSEDSLETFKRMVSNEDSGIYLVLPKTIYSSNRSQAYIYFHSKNDQDYQSANPKSRSIHFIRYITQLTKNVTLLLDNKDATMLAQKSPNIGKKKTRSQKYTVCERELQKEDSKLESIGALSTTLVSLDSKQELHSSNAGLYLIESRFQGPQIQKVTTEQFISTENFGNFFSLSEIDENAEICEHFKEKYLEFYHKDVFQEIEKTAASKKAALLDGAEVSDLYKLIDFGIIQNIYQSQFPLDFTLLNSFFKMSCMDSQEGKNWKTGLQLKINLSLAISHDTQKKLERLLKERIEKLERKDTLKKLVLLHLLDAKSIKLSDSENFSFLLSEAKRKFVFGFHWKFCFGSLDKVVLETFEKELKRMLSNKSDEKKLELLIKEHCKLLETLALEEITENRDLQNSTYIAYKRQAFTQYIQPQIEEIRREEIIGKFSKIVQSKIYNQESCDQDKQQVINSIVFVSKHATQKSRFQVKYSKMQNEEIKVVLDIKRLTLDNSEREKVQGQSDIPLETKMLNISSLCRITLPQLDNLRFYPVNAGLALLTANCGKQSKVIIYGTSKGQPILEEKFGKRISGSDFDAINKMLCLYSQHEEVNELNFYQFDANYKNCGKYSCIDLTEKFHFQGVATMKLQYGSKSVWVLESTGNRLLKLNIKNGRVTNSGKLTNLVSEIGNFTDLHMASNGQCVFLSIGEEKSLSVMTESFNVLEEPLPSFEGKSIFQVPETNICLVAALKGSEVSFEKLTVQGAQQELKLQESFCVSANDHDDTTLQSSENRKHWIYNLFWVFIKFPCEDVFMTEQVNVSLTAISCDQFDVKFLSKQMKKIHEEIRRNLRVTFKPIKTMCEQIHTIDMEELLRSKHEILTKYSTNVCQFLQQLIIFTPMQIARCQANEFLVLKDGSALSTQSAQDVFEMKDDIDLGLFEAIFNWWSGSVKVISSMGKQSTGKSYMLNHVMGTSFNISGARCTDGCWMTLNVQEDCLYVVLDFEGLGSFERTDQDDMLLSLFNSAISTMTLFKTEHRIDRDTDQLFSRFNLGSDQLKGTGGIFNGSFVIVIKDVAEADLRDIGKEFVEKMNNLLLKEKQNNFITKMYKGGFHINPFPPFQTENFFEEIGNLREDIISAQPLFTGGPMFRDTMKLLLAKLAINDFTPLGKQQFEARIKFIKNHLEIAFIHGVLAFGTGDSDESSSPLTLLDQQNERVPENWTLSEQDLDLGEVEMKDSDNHFTEDGFLGLVTQFSQHVTQTSANFTEWRASLEKFVSLCLQNRFSRIESWIDGNIKAWQSQNNPEFDDLIHSLWDKVKLEKTLLQQKIQFCDKKCSKCFLICAQIAKHVPACSCTTSHQCTENCFYCGKDKVSPCKHLFGHENEHFCSEFSHICGKKCFFNAINECANECVLLSNHEEFHKCSLKKHLCKKTCSVDICSGECQLDCSIPHEVHKCAKEQCVYECCVENCKNKCTASNHFHGNSSLTEKFRFENGIEIEEAPFTFEGEELHIEEHFCGAEHTCGRECQQDGYCEVLVEKTISKEEVFQGKRSTFSYKKQFVQIGKKLPCLRKILPFEKDHSPAEHFCTLTMKNHVCTEICPTCENICDKTYGHWKTEGDEKHHTAHGNMTKCYFICNREDFDIGDHKYKKGEQSDAEFCHLMCNSLGRGHIHVVECPGNCEDEFSAEHDHRRHETCKYGPNEDIPKDEIQHRAFWELIGFEDPCTGENTESFEKCPFYCSAHEEEKSSDGDVKRYHCQLDLWHKPVVKLSDTGLTKGTVSKDGHVFPCHHEPFAFHWVFALDRSFSMGGKSWGLGSTPWKELQKSVMSFMHSRKSMAPVDRYSILLHATQVHIIEENKLVKNFDGIELAKWSTKWFGGNDFSLALSECDDVINRHLDNSISPVLIFMSDGKCPSGQTEMEKLSRKYKTDYKLKVYTIGFGKGEFDKLKELAVVAGGDYIECPTGIELSRSFLEIASSIPPTVSVTSSK